MLFDLNENHLAELEAALAENHEDLLFMFHAKRALPLVVDMVLYCPYCFTQHIDAPEPPEVSDWKNPPHRTHLCHECKKLFKPADIYTNGVDKL